MKSVACARGTRLVTRPVNVKSLWGLYDVFMTLSSPPVFLPYPNNVILGIFSRIWGSTSDRKLEQDIHFMLQTSIINNKQYAVSLSPTCIVETVQHRRFSEVQPSEGDSGEQRALGVAGSLQTLQRSGLRAAGHHRLQPVVQHIHRPQGALLGRWARAGHLASLPVPLQDAHPGGVLPCHVGDLRALPGVHSANLGRVSALSPVSFHLSSVLCPVFSSALSTVFSSRSLFAHLSSLERSASEFVPPHLRLINSHQLPIISHQEARLDPTRSRRDRGGSVGRGGGGEERETHPEVKVFSFSVRFGDCFLASCRTQSAVHSLKRCHRLSACLNIKQRVLLGLSSTQQPSYSQLRSTHSQRIQHRADIRW